MHATGVPVDEPVVIQFSEAMQAATVNMSTVLVKNGGNVVNGTVSYDPTTNRATFVPTAAFAANTSYGVTVTSVAKDLAGNALTPFTGSITTTTAMWTVTSAVTGNGSINPASAQQVVHNGTVTYSITPGSNNLLVGITLNGASQPVPAANGNGTYNYTTVGITTNTAVVFTFVAATHTVTVTVGANGSVSPNGAVTVAHGADQTFTITPLAVTLSLGERSDDELAAWRAAHPDDPRNAGLLDLPLEARSRAQLPFLAPHLSEQLLAGRRGDELHSTLDLRLQRQLEQLVAQFVAERRPQGVRNALALLVDSRDQAVKALVGSADYFSREIHGQVNGVQARRSPGSTLKPLLYALALDQGVIHPLSIVKDAPSAFGAFQPENFDGKFAGPLTAQEALIRSRNVPAVWLASQLRQPSLHGLLQRAGVRQLREEEFYGLALALEQECQQREFLRGAAGPRSPEPPRRQPPRRVSSFACS